jgi:uncharacterized membrane protein
MLDLSAGRRVTAAVVIGLVVGVVVALFAAWPVALTVAWDAAAALFLATVWLHVGGLNPRATQAHATREDPGRVGAGLLLLAAAVASLIGTAFDLLRASQADRGLRFLLTLVAIGTVVMSWAVVQSVFTLRYAHEYYMAPVGGIDFKTTDEAPDYRDFAYVAFTVGMTFQVSDTDVQTWKIRRTVLRHALLSYLFGAVIIAVTINIVAQLFQ